MLYLMCWTWIIYLPSNVETLLLHICFQVNWVKCINFCLSEKMISSESLEGVPLLVLANKQDVPVLSHLDLSTVIVQTLSSAIYSELHSFCVCVLVLFVVATLISVLCLPSSQNCLSVPDIKTAFSDAASKIGRRDCLVQPCTALTG